jgi:hypothetical protein
LLAAGGKKESQAGWERGEEDDEFSGLSLARQKREGTALEVKEEICRNWAKMLVFWLTLDPIFSSPRSSTEILFIGGVRGPYCLYWGKFSALDSTRGIQTVGSKCAPRAAKFGSSRL